MKLGRHYALFEGLEKNADGAILLATLGNYSGAPSDR